MVECVHAKIRDFEESSRKEPERGKKKKKRLVELVTNRIVPTGVLSSVP